MRRSRTRYPLAVAALAVTGAALSAACTDERVIFRDRPFFEDPPEVAGGFLGYDEQDVKLTVCGNCHVGKQSEWEETAHADAWAGLQDSGHAQAFCEDCHTVNALGNVSQGQVGWAATEDPRYHDVQCESCHGPGEAHVANPDAPAKPQASLAVGPGLTNGCGECHDGTHHPFVSEWEQSPHARVVAFAAGRQECASCHRGQGTLRAWGENAEYVEKEGDALPVTCGVCHDPHDATNEHQLRFTVNTTSIEEHLCARCHDRRTVPDPESAHGLESHAPQSALLVGDAGWFPPGADIGQGEIRGTHGSGANPTLCTTCHLPGFEVTDRATGEFVFAATGHLFRPMPCVDAQGIPQPFETDCAISTSARSFAGCTSSSTGLGCHGDGQAVVSALTRATTAVRDLVEELETLLDQVDPDGEAPGGEIDPTNPTFTVAEGALFNLNLATFGNADFGTNTVLGSTVHNPFLIQTLLAASIDAVEDRYGVAAASGTDWKAEIRRILAEAER